MYIKNCCSKRLVQWKHRSLERECTHAFRRKPSVQAQISCSAVIFVSLQSGVALKVHEHQNAFLFMMRLGPLKWIPPLKFHSKGIIEFYDAACEISIVLDETVGDLHTALLFACKWAASNSMTTDAINNGHTGWNPCWKKMHSFNKNKATMVETVKWKIRK